MFKVMIAILPRVLNVISCSITQTLDTQSDIVGVKGKTFSLGTMKAMTELGVFEFSGMRLRGTGRWNPGG